MGLLGSICVVMIIACLIAIYAARRYSVLRESRTLTAIRHGPVEWRSGRVVGLYVYGKEFDDNQAGYLTAFTRLKELQIDCSGITGKGIKHVAALPQLETLWLFDDKLTMNELKELRKSPVLKRVILLPNHLSPHELDVLHGTLGGCLIETDEE